MNTTQKLALPSRIFKHGTEPNGLKRVNMCSSLKLVGLVKDLLGSDFEKLEKSFLSPVIKLGLEETIQFSGKLVHYLLQRRILTTQDMWFTFGGKLMRFSLREFFLTTGLPCCVVGEPSSTVDRTGDREKTYSWMRRGMQLKDLICFLESGKSTISSDEKVRLGATILVEGILLAQHASKKIPVWRLLLARSFEEYCSYHWGKCAYEALVRSVAKLSGDHLSREQYELSGFPIAIQFWALSSVHQLGKSFGRRVVSTTNGPLCLEWTHTSTPQLKEVARIAELDGVEVKCIVGDPKLYSNLVEEAVDVKFRKVIELVEKGYRIKTSDWVNGYVDVLVASREIENQFCLHRECNEKLDKLTKLYTLQQKRVESLEILLGIKENGEQGKHTEFDIVSQVQEGEKGGNEVTEVDIREEPTGTAQGRQEENTYDKVVEDDTPIDRVTPNKKKKQIVEEEEGENGSKMNRTRKDGMEVDEDTRWRLKYRKRERKNDKWPMGRCQTQVPSDHDALDDSLTIAQMVGFNEKKSSDVNNSGGEASEPLRKKSRVEADNNDMGPCQKPASIRDDGDETVAPPEIEQRNEEADETGSKARKNLVASPCDDELEVGGSTADMIDDGSKEPNCLIQEDGVITGEKQILDEKLCSDSSESAKEDDDRFIQKNLARDELALKVDKNEPSPRQKLASGAASGDETSKAFTSKVLSPSDETNIYIAVGEGSHGQDCLLHDKDLISEETIKSNERFEDSKKRKNNVGEGDADYDSNVKRFQKLKVLASSIGEQIFKAEKKLAWLKERRAMNKENWQQLD